MITFLFGTGSENFEFPLTRKTRVNSNQIAHCNGFSRLLNQAVFLSHPGLFKVWTTCNEWAGVPRFRLSYSYIGSTVRLTSNVRYNSSIMSKKFESMHLKTLISWLGVAFSNFCCTNHARFEMLLRKNKYKNHIILKFIPCPVVHCIHGHEN